MIIGLYYIYKSLKERIMSGELDICVIINNNTANPADRSKGKRKPGRSAK